MANPYEWQGSVLWFILNADNRFHVIPLLTLLGVGSTPIAICTGHELPITCVDVNTSIGIIASGSVGKNFCSVCKCFALRSITSTVSVRLYLFILSLSI